jgi:hypothetical protein
MLGEAHGSGKAGKPGTDDVDPLRHQIRAYRRTAQASRARLGRTR